MQVIIACLIENNTAMTSIQKQIVIRNDGQRVAYVSVSNSKRLNVINSSAMKELSQIIQELNGEDSLRAIVLSGTGERAFIGGADIREMVTLDSDSAAAFITTLHHSCLAIRTATVPVIARIQGYCLGAGLEVAASCDLRIAAQGAVFGMPEVKVGLPSVIEAALLPRLIGWGKTNQLLLTGDSIDANQALAWGLVEQVVTAEQLADTVEHTIDSIISAGPQAVRAQKALLRQWEELPLSQAVTQGIVTFRNAYQTDEPQQYMQRFLNRKRD